MLRPPALVAVAVAVTAGAAAVAGVRMSGGRADAARSLLIGLQDDRLAQAQVDPGPRLDMLKRMNAEVVRVDLRWDLVAPSRPARARDSADPAYDWSTYDRVVDAARARGLRLLVSVWGTPPWARDPSVPERGMPGFSVRPRRLADAGDFAYAVARRYGPRGVHLYEAWNEPNIPLFLQPQFRRARGRWVPESPRLYSAMLKAMYAGFHGGDRRATVAGGVTAPAGDADPQSCPQQPVCRVTPRAFVRALDARGLRPPMDVYAHHPYPLRPPTNSNFAGASYVDLYNLLFLTKELDGTYLRGKGLWLTEFGIATRRVTQYPFHRTPAQQRAGLVDALARVRANPRVKVFIWYLLQDHPEWASGLLDQSGRPKPAAAVFRREARR